MTRSRGARPPLPGCERRNPDGDRDRRGRLSGRLGAGQILTGWLSDHTGRKPLIVAGMLVQGAALVLLLLGGGMFAAALAAAVLLGAGTALVYPTLIAAVSDAVQPVDRARAVGVYRFWRDFGFVAGALIAGFASDQLGTETAIGLVAALTAASGVIVAATRWNGVRRPRHRVPFIGEADSGYRHRGLAERAAEK